MSFRIFSRVAWQANSAWPEGFEPLAMPMDECPTLDIVATQDDARRICSAHNDARPVDAPGRFTASYYEYTEV